MPLPLILAGPILRRVEPNLVAVWVALKDAATVKLTLWEDQIEAPEPEDITFWFRSPDPGAKTIRLGEKLHVVVVTLRLPEAKTLVRERLYSYDLEIAPDGQTTKHTLKSLGLLSNDPPNADPDGDHTKRLALGYETNRLPCVVLPPKELKDLKIVHGSCRDPDNDFPDGLAWLDDLLSNNKAYTSAIDRPHQLFLTGDQIYADEVPRPLLKMLNDAVKELFGATAEQLPLKDPSDPQKTIAVPADLVHFPVGRRGNLIKNEAGMTTTEGACHLMSFGEFCAMHLSVWSNELKNALSPDAFPPPEDLPPKVDGEVKLPDAVKDAITKNNAGEVIQFLDYGSHDSDAPSYDVDKARLTEFYRTLPKVRRALANVPTYMIFDDHEITDDWYLNPTWRDRVLGSPLGSAIVRNGMLAYALFQGWGNDPVKFEPRVGRTEKQPHEQLLDLATRFLPSGATTGPDIGLGKPASQIEDLLGLNLRNQIAADGSFAETEPKLKWFYTVPGAEHQVLVLDCRTRRAFASRISPPGNIGLTAQAEQIPEKPDPADRKVWIVVSSLPVLGPPIFDELFAPLLFRAFDFKNSGDLQRNRGTKRVPGTNPDAVEAWCFDPKLFESLLSRLKAYSPVVVLSGDVHYSATNSMSYWFKKNKEDKDVVKEPACLVQFISSGLKNRSFAFAQRIIRSKIGAERLGWLKNSPSPVNLPAGANISPRLRTLLGKSPLLLPTRGWHGAHTDGDPDWAWRVSPIGDIRQDKDRPKMTQPASLFPDDADKKDDDVGKTDIDGYQRIAERHSRQLKRLNNSRQILFASSLAVVTFQKRKEKNRQQKEIEIIYAIQELFTIQSDPEELTARPKPQVYTRHEVPLQDVIQDPPTINPITPR
jgi:hypothetical protein